MITCGSLKIVDLLKGSHDYVTAFGVQIDSRSSLTAFAIIDRYNLL